MTIKILAQKIPNHVRSEILLTKKDIINKALPNADNNEMKMLLKIWYEFVEPTQTATTCQICINNILTNFKQMKDALQELEREYLILKSL